MNRNQIAERRKAGWLRRIQDKRGRTINKEIVPTLFSISFGLPCRAWVGAALVS